MALGDPRLRPPRRGLIPRRGGGYYHQAPLRPPPPAPPPPNGGRQIAALSSLNVIAGIWLIIAPWVLGYNDLDPKWNDVIFGIVIGVFAITRATGAFWDEWLSWINALVGGWLFVAAFTIDHSSIASANDIVLGIVVFLVALASASVTAAVLARRRGPGPPP